MNLRDPPSKGVFFSVTSTVDVVGISRPWSRVDPAVTGIVASLSKSIDFRKPFRKVLGFPGWWGLIVLMASRNPKGNGYHCVDVYRLIKPL